MVLRKIPLKKTGKEQFFDAVIMVNDKFLLDQVDEVWEKMNSQGYDKANCRWGPFNVEIRPRMKNAAT